MQANHTLPRKRTSSGARRSERVAPYIFVSPFYIVFTLFFLFPSLSALVLGFYRWNGIDQPRFVGLRNFTRLFNDRVFLQAVENTAIYAAASLFFIMPLALVLAVLLNAEALRFKGFWRALYFTPVVTSAVAVSFVFRLLYNSENGMLNVPLVMLGLEPIDWLGDRDVVKLSMIILLAWRSVGLLSIYFLAGLQSIDRSLYEAAAIDGANAWQNFAHITVPMLRPIILFVSVLVTINSLQIFDEPKILTDGGPANSSLSVVQYLYDYGFTRLRFGYASAVGTVLFVAIFVISTFQLGRFGLFREDDHA